MKNRFAITMFLIAAAIVTGILMSIHPWEVYKRENVQATGLAAQAIDLEHKKADLMHERDQLQDPLRKQETIRQMGWVKKDEVPIK